MILIAKTRLYTVCKSNDQAVLYHIKREETKVFYFNNMQIL